MLGKLIKYELKACGRIFIPIYICILVVAAIIGIFSNTQILEVPVILVFVLMGLFVALGVMTVVLILQRFKKNLLEDEGYLMFTLPVSTKSLILSKYITSLIYMVLSIIVAILTFTIILLFGGNLDVSVFGNHEFWTSLNQILLQKNIVSFIILAILGGLATYTLFIFNVYLSLAIGQLPKFNGNRIIISVITFFIINIIIGIIQSTVSVSAFAMQTTININTNTTSAADVINGINTALGGINAYNIVNLIVSFCIIVVLFIGTNWILNKKLNLE